MANELVVCNGVNLEFQFTGKYDENRSNENILTVRDILRYVMIVYLATTTDILRKIVYKLFNCPSFGHS